jgi:N-sulfoglucosamine sulfohydrolase
MRFLTVATLFGFALPAAAAEPAKVDPRPNILYCLADDWAWPHAGVYGDKVVQTPVFDRVAKEGMLFHQAHCVSPSCTPSRAAMLTGQWIHRLEDSGNLWSILPKRFATYPDLLEKAGYVVGLTGKGWGPGSIEKAERTRNPAGPAFKNFGEFLKTVPTDKPFCFWLGHRDPHRAYVAGSGVKSGMKLEDVKVPPYLPDTAEVRSDILDYYFAVQRFDRDVGEVLKQLEDSGRAANTIVIISGDNGWPFPRGKANLYDVGTHQPLAIRWPARVKPGQATQAFVSLADIAPTVLEAAGVEIPKDMTARSLLGLLTKGDETGRDLLFVERERHAYVRKDNLSYPARAVRTHGYLYIRNLRPDRWPAGDPELVHSVGPFGDTDEGPAKDTVLKMRDSVFFKLAFAKRPAEELYDCRKDPYELTNVADKPEYAEAKAKLRAVLDKWMAETGDPRAGKDGGDDRWDKYPYYGAPAKKP